MLKKYSLLAILAATLVLVGCASDEGIDRFNGMPAQTIYEGGEQALVKHNYDDATDHFEAIQAMYPYGDYARQSDLDIIYAYYMNGEYDSAVSAADRYTHLYPQGPNADYAMYMKGVSEFRRNLGFFERFFPIDRSPRDLSSYRMSFDDFTVLTLQYPDSTYSADARKRMVYMRNMLGKQELVIAQYYYDRAAYIAAIGRAQYIVAYLQNTPQVVGALQLMVQAYLKLGMTTQSNNALQVLAANYPDAAKKLT